MKDSSDAGENADLDGDPAQPMDGPGPVIWLLPMIVLGGAIWIAALAFLFG